MTRVRPIVNRLIEKIEVREPDECWPWKGYVGTLGYGVMNIGPKHHMAHRLVWEYFVGPIPSGDVIDHVCHNRDPECRGGEPCLHRRCVNPSHLRVASFRDNIVAGKSLSAIYARRTHCKRGHDLTDPANIKPNKSGARLCRLCINVTHMENYYRKRAQV